MGRSGGRRVVRPGVLAATIALSTAAGILPGPPSSATDPPTLPSVTSPGCSATPAAPGERTVPLATGGRAGFYIEQLPSTYDGRTPLPVVLDFHGYEEPAAVQVSLSALGTLGEADDFITITPGITTQPTPVWNVAPGSKDLSFVGHLLDAVEKTLCVDQRRVYVTGYSNGAFLTSSVACRFSDRVAAVAPVAGIRDVPGCRQVRPVPVVAFHGTADPLVHFDGSPSAQAAALSPATPSGRTTASEAIGIDLARPAPSIPKDAADWAARNGCAPGPVRSTPAHGVTLTRYRCPNGADVELYAVAGGGHTWPGSKDSAQLGTVLGTTTFAISADTLMWRFFRAHPLTARN